MNDNLNNEADSECSDDLEGPVNDSLNNDFQVMNLEMKTTY